MNCPDKQIQESDTYQWTEGRGPQGAPTAETHFTAVGHHGPLLHSPTPPPSAPITCTRCWERELLLSKPTNAHLGHLSGQMPA